jgi:hypothetical protein
VFTTSIAFPPKIVGSSRALVKTKNEMKKFPCTRHKTKKVRFEGKIYETSQEKRTRANQEKIRLKV